MCLVFFHFRQLLQVKMQNTIKTNDGVHFQESFMGLRFEWQFRKTVILRMNHLQYNFWHKQMNGSLRKVLFDNKPLRAR